MPSRATRGEHGVVLRSDGAYEVRAHADVLAVVTDPDRHSSAVSRFLQIPNGLDGAEHAAWRVLVERFLDADAVAAAEPETRRIARQVVHQLPGAIDTLDPVTDIGEPFIAGSQIAWLGWSSSLEAELVEWMHAHRDANARGDDAERGRVATWFDEIVSSEVATRRRDPTRDDVTARLARELVDGRPLADAELVSILRNWTAGDLATLSRAVGSIVWRLRTEPQVEVELRAAIQTGDAASLDVVIDEILRTETPFTRSRRITTCSVSHGGVAMPRGARIVVDWARANLDPARFGDAGSFEPRANAPHNLVWGAGPHACPGRALSLMQLRAITTELLMRQ